MPFFKKNMKRSNLFYISISFIVYFLVLYLLYFFEARHPDSNMDSFINTIWYSIVTLTTVGYGDFYPVTITGKLISLVFVMGSLGILGFLISQLNYKIHNYMEAKKYGIKGIDISDHTVIFGLNKFSTQVLAEILPIGKQVVVVSNSKDDLDVLIDKYKDSKNLFLFHCDYDNYLELEKINIKGSKCIYASFIDDSETLVHVLNLQSKFEGIKIIVNLNKPFLKETFTNAGVMFSISQEEIASKLIASYIFEPNAAAITEDLMTSAVTEGTVDLQEYAVVEGNPFINNSYNESFQTLKQKYNLVLLGIYKNNKQTLLKNPEEDVVIELNDRLIFLADSVKTKTIEKDFRIKQGA
jgi:voltage-gated potassium channel